MFDNKIISGVLEREGGYVNNPADPGGKTCWGITERVARNSGYNGDMASLTKEEAYSILFNLYWIRPGFDKIDKLSAALAQELCDTATNMGAGVAVKWLQRWLNVFNQGGKAYPDIAVDGVTGPGTLNALTLFLTERGKQGEHVLLAALNCSQGNRYLELAESKTTNEVFVYGWLKERVFIASA
ncbi:glycoside hydrolase family 108 protein [Rahnella sp. BCC 1045]|uniref:glycoside hydrolase family 108 protein n=1 Tax=Rahnella sp. BCC 1045 TaxID=2816251 RepID=UPI001C265BD2|nr:glycoside hydrolase family 108 protein [Rahnella sp. BCC 1045]